ncbi:helix-turn-helix transcriptional regulator [Chitinophaga sp. OAE865]|uniref:helix-turn-helix domain-containing protein n=1 Tax=Chitinophaga sp. OAE865 TaxID=2817898 RepID=UPI001AE8C959
MEKIDKKIIAPIGLRLKEARKEQKITFRALSAISSVDTKHIQKIEKGETAFSLISLFKICAALKISPSKIIEMENPFEE